MRLRIIGLCEAYSRRQTPGSEAAAHAARMLALYRRSYARHTGREAAAAEVAEAMWRRYTDMHAAVTNSAPPGHNCHASVRPCPYNKGTTREHRTQGKTKKHYVVDQTQPRYKQINALTEALERAQKDGAHFEAVITRPEIGSVVVDCGRPGRKNNSISSGGHGMKHAIEERHNVTLRQIATSLLFGEIKPDSHFPSRWNVCLEPCKVVLESEYKAGSGRYSTKRMKLHTAERWDGEEG